MRYFLAFLLLLIGVGITYGYLAFAEILLRTPPEVLRERAMTRKERWWRQLRRTSLAGTLRSPDLRCTKGLV